MSRMRINALIRSIASLRLMNTNTPEMLVDHYPGRRIRAKYLASTDACVSVLSDDGLLERIIE